MGQLKRLICACILLVPGYINLCLGETTDSTFYFYHGKTYGSESLFNPFTVIANGGFGILQISNRSNRVSDIDFSNGWKNVTYNLSHPFQTIDAFGWEKFWKQEVFPTSFKLKQAQYYPNYKNHLWGGGFTYRAFVEWYRFHGYHQPVLWAFSSLMGYHFLNEVVENNYHVGPNVDPISDMYIFNTAGVLLFSINRVARFFGNTLHMRDWSFMPGYDPWQNTIENIGQNFMIKLKLPFLKSWSYFNHWGVHGMFGLSHLSKDGTSISFAGGLVAKDLVQVNNDPNIRELTTTLVWTAGVFYDRENSLLASLILSGTKGYKVRLNIYPGLVKYGRFSPGFFLNLRQDNQVVLGFHFYYLLPAITGRIGKQNIDIKKE
jgi:hypothetical protein